MVQLYLQVQLSVLGTKVCTIRHRMHLIIGHCSVAGPFQGLTKDVEIATVPQSGLVSLEKNHTNEYFWRCL